jgi:hypothetical protein
MESCSSRLWPLSTNSMIRSPQLRGQELPPDPPSPLGGSTDTCRGLANGCPDLPHFCYPVASSRPLSPERTRMNRSGTPYSTYVPSQRTLDRMTLNTKRRKSRPVSAPPRTPRSASQGGRSRPRCRGAAARPAAPSAPSRDAWPPRWHPPAGSRARASVLQLIKPNETTSSLWIDVCDQMRHHRPGPLGGSPQRSLCRRQGLCS